MKLTDKIFDKYCKHTSYEELISALVDTLLHKLNLNKLAIYRFQNESVNIFTNRGYSSNFVKNYKENVRKDKIQKILNNNKKVTVLKNEKDIVEGKSKNAAFFPLKVKNDNIGFLFCGKNENFKKNELLYMANAGITISFILNSMKLEKSIEKLHIYDKQTGAYNTNYFYIRLSEYLNKLDRFGDNFSLLYLKYRYFIKLKNKYGLDRINKSFKSIVELLQNNVRSIDQIYRYKKDGFTILFEGDIEGAVYNIIERIKNKLSELIENKNFDANFNLGLINVNQKAKKERIIELLDEVIYRSERTGDIVILNN